MPFADEKPALGEGHQTDLAVGIKCPPQCANQIHVKNKPLEQIVLTTRKDFKV